MHPVLLGLIVTLFAHPSPTAAPEAAPRTATTPTGDVRVPTIVGHRGASHDAPENTLPSFALAFAQGADAIEGDFYVTADGQVVCFHDRELQRLAGVDGKTTDRTLAELRALDVGRWKAPQFTGTRMPTLAEVLAVVPTGKRIFVECKSGPEIVPPLLDGLAASGLAVEQVTIIAFDAEVIAAIERTAPQYDTQWLTGWRQDRSADGAWHPSVDDVIATAKRIGADGVDVQANLAVVDTAFVEKIRAAGLAIHCWTVNDPFTAQALARLGVDSITTDRPEFLRAALEAPSLGASLAGRLTATKDAPPGVFGPAVRAADTAAGIATGWRLSDAFTLATWFRVASWQAETALLDAGAYGWRVSLDGRGTLRARHAGHGVVLEHALPRTAALGTWRHVALTVSAPAAGVPGLATLLVDGLVAATAPLPTHAGAGDTITAARCPDAELVLDDVALFDRPLSPDELQAILHRGVAATLPDLVR